jgi:hypothetical protein
MTFETPGQHEDPDPNNQENNEVEIVGGENDEMLMDPQEMGQIDHDHDIHDNEDDKEICLTKEMATKDSLAAMTNNVECFVCSKLLMPSMDHPRYATECIECEVGVCNTCVPVGQCPRCK